MVDLSTITETFTLIGVLISGAIFVRLMFKAKSLGSFRFQLSLFMLVWVGAEVPHIMETLGLIVVGSLDSIGLAAHMISMAVFAVFVGARSVNFLRLKPPVQPATMVTVSTGVIKNEPGI